MTRVLVVDDDRAVRFAIVEALSARGCEVIEAADVDAALAAADDVEVLVTDLVMPGKDGLALLREARARWPELPVVMLTARGSERIAVEAMQAGAHHYLAKPFDVDELALVVARAAETAGLRRGGRRGEAERRTGKPLIGDSPAMRALLARVERLARRDVTVLVRGETGTGKELVATMLHALSPRAAGPLVRFNCAALPTELAEAELFGHARGAFTGAAAARAGYLERADGGTLVLDEVGELPAPVQAKLLRALGEGEIQPVGAGRPLRVDVRIVACTHRELAAEVAGGRFREDLYYRLAVVELAVPPLRERAGDVAPLAHAFAARAAERFGLEGVRLSDDLLAALAGRPWPGNVRELENLVTRLVAESDGGELTAAALDGLAATATATATAAGATTGFRARVDAFERGLLEEALRAAGGNKALAARRLGLSRVTLHDRLKRLGVDSPLEADERAGDGP